MDGVRADADEGRARWTALADRLLDGARRRASPEGAWVLPPGAPGGFGRRVDGLEGFARTALLAAFRIVGERGVGTERLAETYARGIAAGVDPRSPERWVRLDEHPQAKVEGASLALVLDMTRPWIWDRLDARTRARVVEYLAPAVGDRDYPRSNWLWFRIVVQTFLRSVGGPWSAQEIADDLAVHDGLRRADGWISDGPDRSFDHYVGWALHLYPVLWSRMRGADALDHDRTAEDVAALDRYLRDAVALVGADGSPLIQGRSLVYRFAAAAPFWAGVLAGVPSSSPGLLRHAAARVVGHFTARGAPDAAGLLSLGWHGEWRRLAQGYSGPASPYWAVKGLLGVMLPADHPVWSAPSEPLPVERGDVLRAVVAPGWVVSGTRADGIVRVVNHGTDHAAAGASVGDSPLYARIGYATAAAPLHDGRAWRDPVEQSVVLVDEAGRATHRAGMEPLGVRTDGRTAIAASAVRAHWIDPDPVQERVGSGIAGVATDAGRLTVQSVVRGPWELRLVRVDALADARGTVRRLRVGGWALAGDDPEEAVAGRCARVRSGGILSAVTALAPGSSPSVRTRRDASPLGDVARVPVVELPAVPGTWSAVLVTLDGTPSPRPPDAAARVTGADVVVTWPDGVVTTTPLLPSHPEEDAP